MKNTKKSRVWFWAAAVTAIIVITFFVCSGYIITRLISGRNAGNDIPEGSGNAGGNITADADPGSETTPDIEPEPQPQPEPVSDINISFVAFGDNIIHSSVYDDASKLAGGNGYYFDPMYENIKDIISSADISFINQETPLCGPELGYAGYPNFNTPDELGDTLMNLGFDIINIANNHMLDKRGKGLKRTIEYWQAKPITLLGGHINKDDYNSIRVIEKEGIKIALLSYTYDTNGMTLESGYTDLYIPLIDNADIERQVKEAKQLADLVFVSIHWGIENSFAVSAEQRETAQVIVDSGADVIIGHHPHVIQEMKWKDRPDGGKTLIIYSLGNLLSTMEYPINMLGAYVSFNIEKKGDGPIQINNIRFTPTMTHYNKSRRGLKIYLFESYSQAMYETHGTTLKSAAYSYDEYVRLVKKTISGEFLSPFFTEEK